MTILWIHTAFEAETDVKDDEGMISDFRSFGVGSLSPLPLTAVFMQGGEESGEAHLGITKNHLFIPRDIPSSQTRTSKRGRELLENRRERMIHVRSPRR